VPVVRFFQLEVFVTSRADSLVVVCAGRPRLGDWLGVAARSRLRNTDRGACGCSIYYNG
jgi:hypothetical protein